MKKIMLSLLSEKRKNFTVAIGAVLLGFLFGAIILLILGKNPLQVYYALLQGSGFAVKEKYAKFRSVFTDFMSLVNYLTPLLLASLAFAVAFKAGLFNIAISGQMLFSGFMATILVGYVKMPLVLGITLSLLIGIVAGGFIGVIIGYLKHKFNINEVVSSIMLNYIIMYIVGFVIQKYYIDPISRQSKNIYSNVRITIANFRAFGLKFDLPIGIIIAIIVAFLLHYIFKKTLFGFEVIMIGKNRTAAKYSGVNVGRRMLQSMVLSGALAGMAGITYYLGYFSSIPFNTLNQTGFTAISVSLLGANSPIAIIFSSLLISIINKGSTFMSSKMGVEPEIASVITSIILVFSALSEYFRSIADKFVEKQTMLMEKSSKKDLEGGSDE